MGGGKFRFLADEISEPAVLKATEDKDPERDKEHKCEACYYVGMAHLLGIGGTGLQPVDRDTGYNPMPPSPTKAKEYFEKCLATGVKDFTDYQRAEYELKRLSSSVSMRGIGTTADKAETK